MIPASAELPAPSPAEPPQAVTTITDAAKMGTKRTRDMRPPLTTDPIGGDRAEPFACTA
ncbi:hypothetical protein GCM10010428_46530 [Actinosynnema pretiosum subsp. pretiosum]